MSAPPTQTQGLSAGASAGGKRRREDDTDYGGNGGNGNGVGADDETEESSEGELTHEEMMERKEKKRKQLKQLTEDRHHGEAIGKVVQAHPTPQASTALARAIQEFAKMVMGIPRKARNSSTLDKGIASLLPDAPTEEEKQDWLNRKQARENVVRDTQDNAMKTYLAKKPQGYKPNRKQRKMIEEDALEAAALHKAMKPVVFKSRMASDGMSRYPYHFGTQCEAALAIAGFPRCTFDWDASYDTPWNSTTSSIILSVWVKAFDANAAKSFGILTSENTSENREQILRRWVGNKKQKYKDQLKLVALIATPDGKKKIQEDEAVAEGIARKKRILNKIYEARKSVVVKVFGRKTSEYAMVEHLEIHSEDEIDSGGSVPVRHKKRLPWRSAELNTFISLLDECHKKRYTLPKEIRAATALVDRGKYATQPETERFPPKGFQQSLLSEEWLESQEALVISELRLNEEHSVDIEKAIIGVTGTLRKVGSLKADIVDSTMS